jgi:hypothetical protein
MVKVLIGGRQFLRFVFHVFRINSYGVSFFRVFKHLACYWHWRRFLFPQLIVRVVVEPMFLVLSLSICRSGSNVQQHYGLASRSFQKNINLLLTFGIYVAL